MAGKGGLGGSALRRWLGIRYLVVFCRVATHHLGFFLSVA